MNQQQDLVCAFFGHRDAPPIQRELYECIENLIKTRSARIFYVGNNGAFDRVVQYVLQDLSKKYAIQFYVVLAYMPQTHKQFDDFDSEHTLYPDGLETVPKKFAIFHRNRWMVQQADIVVAYVTRSFGGAAQFLAYARNQKKEVINLGEMITR